MNVDRREALSLVRVCADLAGAVAAATKGFGQRPLILATGAKAGHEDECKLFSFAQAHCYVSQQKPILLLFGTAWGLSPAVLAMG